MGNTVLSAYIVDNYPDYANEIITFYSVIINVCLILDDCVEDILLTRNLAFGFHQPMVHLLLGRSIRLYLDICHSSYDLHLWSDSMLYLSSEVWR